MYCHTQVVIAGLSNVYTHYITTKEEYAAQRYEAASTIFGPDTLDIYLQKYKDLVAPLISAGEKALHGRVTVFSLKTRDASSKCSTCCTK